MSLPAKSSTDLITQEKQTACEQDAEDDILYLRLDFQSGIAGKKLTRTMSEALVFSVLIIPQKLTACTKIS